MTNKTGTYNNIIIIRINKQINDIYNNEFYGEIGETSIALRALRELAITGKRNEKDFIWRATDSYKIWDLLRWNISTGGRELSMETLAQHFRFDNGRWKYKQVVSN